jgi:threonine dehydrogenase-like Zn-dependent dehydrogenase
MRANTWVAPNKVKVTDVPDPQILHPRDAIVRITSSAICGSDLHLLDGYVPSMMPGDIMGHEFMGEVVEVGPEVGNLTVGDRVVVPFPIACGRCWSCQQELFSVCENTNPNGWMAEKFFGYPTAGMYGYSHMTGGYPGGQAQFARVPFADVNPLKVPDGMSDEQVLFLSDILPTGYFGADLGEVKPGDVVAVWGAGPVGQFAIASARMMGADRIIAIDRFGYRLDMARQRAGATDVIDYTQVDVLETLKELTGGRGPDKAIDAVGMEAHSPDTQYAYDRAKQALRMETDRPIALREAIMAVRSGGIVSIIGAYGGFIDKFPIGAVMNRNLTIRSGQAHVQKYMRPLLDRIMAGDIDPSFVITHRLPLEETEHGYRIFKHKEDGCVKVVLKPNG